MRHKMSCTLMGLILVFAGSLHAKETFNSKDVERGRYLVKVTGCNDCHTPQFGLKGGDVPESEWLIGDSVGWKGPWGVTYPTNLRASVSGMGEKQFISYAKNLKTRPPMPWYSLNAMSKEDLKALYSFIKYLGPSANQIPVGLSPGEKPKGPFMDVTVVGLK